jgi:hypothetical protein
MTNPETNEHGERKWYNEKGLLHREDGPAYERVNGDKSWYIDGKLHREDGPARELENGYKEWYYHGEWIKCFTQEEFKKIIKLRMFW